MVTSQYEAKINGMDERQQLTTVELRNSMDNKNHLSGGYKNVTLWST